MAVVEELKNELYTLDSSLWSINMANILELLSFPVRLNYTCDRQEFLYEYSGKLSLINAKDKIILSDCDEIAEFKMSGKYKRIRMFGVNISNNPKLRNEKAYDIFNVFEKLYGRFIMLVVIADGKLSFVGLSRNNKRHAEVIISEWFGYNDEEEKLEKLLEIDFSLFDNRNLGLLYNEYLWSIARGYVRHPESRMYLIYGCDNSITYEIYVATPNSDEPVLTTRVDREETLKVNSAYYRELYEWDYYIDDRKLEYEEDDVLDEEDAEFEWTMLEMKLDAEAAEEEMDTEEDEDYYSNSEDEDEDYDEDLIGLNPEEMLDFIRNR